MKNPDNIECFSMATRAILRRLLDSFPRPIRIHSAALQQELVTLNELPESCAWRDGINCLVESTLEYLAAENVIRFSEKCAPFESAEDGSLNPVSVWQGVALTSKGFSVLNQPFPENTRQIGHTVASVIRGASSIASAAQTVQVVRQLLQNI